MSGRLFTQCFWWGRWDLNPGSPAPQAGILDQARLRPLRVVQRPSEIEGKIVNTLIKLQSLGKGNNIIYYKFNFFLINHKDEASEKSKNNTSQYSQAIVPQTIRSVSQNSTCPQHRNHPKLNSSVVRHKFSSVGHITALCSTINSQ